MHEMSYVQAIGDRPPRLTDRSKLPLVDACIMEALRLRPPAPMGVPHAPISDTSIGTFRYRMPFVLLDLEASTFTGNFFVPAGVNIMPNIYAMQIDPEHWEKPLEFNPRLHFIDEQGQLKKPTSFAPFGFGRRICLGEQLARNDMFLVVIRLLQHVRLEPIQGVTYTDAYDIWQDLSFVALPYQIRVSARK